MFFSLFFQISGVAQCFQKNIISFFNYLKLVETERRRQQSLLGMEHSAIEDSVAIQEARQRYDKQKNESTVSNLRNLLQSALIVSF